MTPQSPTLFTLSLQWSKKWRWLTWLSDKQLQEWLIWITAKIKWLIIKKVLTKVNNSVGPMFNLRNGYAHDAYSINVQTAENWQCISGTFLYGMQQSLFVVMRKWWILRVRQLVFFSVFFFFVQEKSYLLSTFWCPFIWVVSVCHSAEISDLIRGFRGNAPVKEQLP